MDPNKLKSAIAGIQASQPYLERDLIMILTTPQLFAETAGIANRPRNNTGEIVTRERR